MITLSATAYAMTLGWLEGNFIS